MEGEGIGRHPLKVLLGEIGWMTPPKVLQTLERRSCCWNFKQLFIYFEVSAVPKIRHFKHNSSSFLTRNYKINIFLHVHFIVTFKLSSLVLHWLFAISTPGKFILLRLNWTKTFRGPANLPPNELGTSLLVWKMSAFFRGKKNWYHSNLFVWYSYVFVCIRMLVVCIRTLVVG